MGSTHPVVMIVDDDEVMCNLLSTMLTTKNVHVICAHSIAEAKNYIHAGTGPSVVFLDHLLPDGLGLDFLTEIRAFNKKIKVIMITGCDEKDVGEEAMRHGCFAFLEKPFSYLKISALLEKALRKRKSLFRF